MDSESIQSMRKEIVEFRKQEFINLLRKFGRIIGISIFMLCWYIMLNETFYWKIFVSTIVTYSWFLCMYLYYKFYIKCTVSEATIFFREFQNTFNNIPPLKNRKTD